MPSACASGHHRSRVAETAGQHGNPFVEHHGNLRFDFVGEATRRIVRRGPPDGCEQDVDTEGAIRLVTHAVDLVAQLRRRQ